MACAPARLSQARPHRIHPETFSFPAFFETGTARSVTTRPLVISAEVGHPVDLRPHEPMIMGLWRRNLSTTLRHLLREFIEQQFCPGHGISFAPAFVVVIAAVKQRISLASPGDAWHSRGRARWLGDVESIGGVA